MKGALMKVGQMVSFIAEGLPDEAQRRSPRCRPTPPPMAPSLAASVSCGPSSAPTRSGCSPTGTPAGRRGVSIGQVHRAG